MTTLTDTPKASFRLSMLIYDTRYRSLTIQVTTLGMVCLGIFWLGYNASVNLAKLGLQPNFSFLSSRAGYDISQSLIEYDSSFTHGRAALVGIVNTLLVAVLGCVAATLIGVVAGVLRLSKNWVVSRLMAVYVEGFRNVPLLLWIILIYAVMTESTPQPRDFREGGAASMLLDGSVAITNRGVYIPKPVFESGSMAVIAVLVLSFIGALLYRRYARKMLFTQGRLLPMVWPALAILIVPTLVAFFALGGPISLNYPELGGFNFAGGIQISNPLMALWVALSLYTGAFIAEIVRAGIMAISKGQTEAAYSLGLRPGRTMNLVILPQAMRVIIPPLISQFLNLTKNSSLAIAVGYPDVRATLGGITLNQTGRALECMLLIGLFYLAISLAISLVMNFYNNRMQMKER